MDSKKRVTGMRQMGASIGCSNGKGLRERKKK